MKHIVLLCFTIEIKLKFLNSAVKLRRICTDKRKHAYWGIVFFERGVKKLQKKSFSLHCGNIHVNHLYVIAKGDIEKKKIKQKFRNGAHRAANVTESPINGITEPSLKPRRHISWLITWQTTDIGRLFLQTGIIIFSQLISFNLT